MDFFDKAEQASVRDLYRSFLIVLDDCGEHITIDEDITRDLGWLVGVDNIENTTRYHAIKKGQ